MRSTAFSLVAGFGDGKRWALVVCLSLAWGWATAVAQVEPEFVLIPAGSFEMGNALSASGDGESRELPIHTVFVGAFYMQNSEVTNDQMVEVLNWAYGDGKLVVSASTVQNIEGDQQELVDLDDPDCRILWNATAGAFEMKAEKGSGYPCVEVTWYGCAAYCNYRSLIDGLGPSYSFADWSCNFGADGYRLPTEAEWEKAARGGLSGKRFAWGDMITHALANYYSSDFYFYDVSPTRGYHPGYATGTIPYTSPVGSFGANDYGLYDIAGNVGERCNDWYGRAYYASSPNNDPTGPALGAWRVTRGLGWGSGAGSCRVAFRGAGSPDISGDSVGFRSVRRSQATVNSLPLTPEEAEEIFVFAIDAISTTMIGQDFVVSGEIEVPPALGLGGDGQLQCSPDMENWSTLLWFSVDGNRMSFTHTLAFGVDPKLYYRALYDQPIAGNPPSSRFLEFPLREADLTTPRSPYTHRVTAMFDNNGSAGGIETYDNRVFEDDPRVDEGVTGYAQLCQPGDDPGDCITLSNPSVTVRRVSFDLVNYDTKLPGYSDVTHVFYDGPFPHSGYDYGNDDFDGQTQTYGYLIDGQPIYCPCDGRMYVATDRTTAPTEAEKTAAIAAGTLDALDDVAWQPVTSGHPRLDVGDSEWDDNHTFYIVHENGIITVYIHAQRIEGQVAGGPLSGRFADILENGIAEVSKGDLIGYVGGFGSGIQNGYSPHLHFGVRRLLNTMGSEMTTQRVDPYSTHVGNNMDANLWEEDRP